MPDRSRRKRYRPEIAGGPRARTYIGWPAELSCRSNPGCIRVDYAGVMRAVAKFKPVTVIAEPSDASGARAALEGCGNIKILETPINDAWLRDSDRIGKAVLRPQNRGRGHHLYRAR
ncbi:agmatine deiminase family protein [Leisingera caerulea]|nr:agmatine deiminase family protein [Leisingera caerulea]